MLISLVFCFGDSIDFKKHISGKEKHVILPRQTKMVPILISWGNIGKPNAIKLAFWVR